MVADTGRNCVVHAGSRGGVVAVGVGIHVCGNAWSSSNIFIVVGVVQLHELVNAWPVGVVLWWLVLSAQREHRLAEDSLHGGNELALAQSLQHLKAVAGLVWRGAEVDALVCGRLQLVSLMRRAYARQNIRRKWLTNGGRPVLRSCGVIVSSAVPQRWCATLEIRLACDRPLPSVVLGSTGRLVHHALGLLQRAHVALGRVLPWLVLAAVGV
eukprot:3472195-Pleurochrysis_carterae.AAC.1